MEEVSNVTPRLLTFNISKKQVPHHMYDRGLELLCASE